MPSQNAVLTRGLPQRSRQAVYLRLNGKYLREAEELLAKRDYAQASEKLWGAVAETIKALAAKRALQLGTHRSLGEFVVKLHKEHPDLGLMSAFRDANALHTNFYEDWLPPELVLDGARAAKEFVEKLKRFV